MNSSRILLKVVSCFTVFTYFLVCWPGPHGGPQFLWEVLAGGLAQAYWLPIVISIVIGLSLIAMALSPFLANEKKVFRFLLIAAISPVALLVYVVGSIASSAFVFTFCTAAPFFIGAVVAVYLSSRETGKKLNG